MRSEKMSKDTHTHKRLFRSKCRKNNNKKQKNKKNYNKETKKQDNPKICRLCVCVIINKRSFESFMCLGLIAEALYTEVWKTRSRVRLEEKKKEK